MRCYFNLADAQQFLLDNDGVEVADVNELRAQVTKTIDELRYANPTAARSWEGWRLEVTDNSGRVLLTINLDDPFTPEALAPFGSLLLFKSCELGEYFTHVVPNGLLFLSV
jgi:hypothetical protein